MRHLDAHYVEECIARLGKIPEDAVPKWGKLTKSELVQHLLWVVKTTMGRAEPLPNMGNWFSRALLRPLLLHGMLPIPKNIQLPERLRKQGYTLREPGDLEDLHAVLEEYLRLVQVGELDPPSHPALGDLGVDGWSVLHVRHFEHHLKQFGV